MRKNLRLPNRPGRPAPGKSLTPQAVAEAAARLIDTEGLAEFSMRRLGQSLGVEAMALYNHFEDKDAILNAVASLALTRVKAPSATGPWQARIKQVCLSIRRLALEHPNLFRLAMTRPTPPSAAFPLVEGSLAAFAEAGLNPETQATVYNICIHYIRGFCLWEIDEFSRRDHREQAATPAIAQQYPRTAQSFQKIFSPDRDRLFEEGLDAILHGICGNPNSLAR